ncbi:restriction endonuclease subunit S [Bacteroides xylanisolvens]|uniref:Restriction endonuclease subunit S n=1 Tax=Bacteroides xylanisolvens TaxID=371601 RepID=A0A7J5PHP4_9BACE|nr:restriction endonuclease subunit S [Bacteroides xylanisolvens]KAB6107088.1 restriction endonuclease subunit S [Bacteroides xylanisolvens]KAB6119683.1 restriction endonuclease subunit S [Bacteroides xylanisolvens]KAB6138004.1 restriction endonuclease subunit S [Bacteroides xylanisolvens]MCS3376950.1 restriction endonuclease subunit S [Bacteroides xylanisolvens]
MFITLKPHKPHYENVPFEIPSSWEWTTINTISKSILYGVSESAKTNGKYRLLRITDIQNNSVQWDSVPYTDFDENKAKSYLLSDGDILFARTGATVGKSYLVQGLTEEAIYASYLIRVQTYDAVLPQYVKFYFESGYYWEQIEQGSVGVGQPNVNGTILGNLHVPIPPIHEQFRIVSELSKWMGIIDIIEMGKTDLQTIIKQVKSKILDLAIQGKLVAQDPSDEPASELLKRINPKAEFACDNGHYTQLSDGWTVCRLEQVTNYEQPTAYIVNSTTYDDSYLTPVLTAGKSFIIGYTNETAGIYSNLPCIIFDDFTTDSKKVDFPFKVKSSAMKILKIHKDIEIDYVAMFMSITRLVGDTHKRYWISEYSKLEIPIPPKAEQKRIVYAAREIFTQLDEIMESL